MFLIFNLEKRFDPSQSTNVSERADTVVGSFLLRIKHKIFSTGLGERSVNNITIYLTCIAMYVLMFFWLYQLSEIRKKRPNVQHSAHNTCACCVFTLLAFLANCKYMTLSLQSNCVMKIKKKNCSLLPT